MQHIATTQKSGLTVAQVGGNDIYKMYSQVQYIIASSNLGEEYAKLFAEPVEEGRIIDWYDKGDAESSCVTDLPGEEKVQVLRRFCDMYEKLHTYAAELRAKGGSYKSYADILEKALIIPGQNYIYAIEGNPVLVCWGFSEGDNDAVEESEKLIHEIDTTIAAEEALERIAREAQQKTLEENTTTPLTTMRDRQAENPEDTFLPITQESPKNLLTETQDNQTALAKVKDSQEDTHEEIPDAITREIQTEALEESTATPLTAIRDRQAEHPESSLEETLDGQSSLLNETAEQTAPTSEEPISSGATITTQAKQQSSPKLWKNLLWFFLLLLIAGAIWYFWMGETPHTALKGDYYVRGALANDNGELVDLRLNFSGTGNEGTGYLIELTQTCQGTVKADPSDDTIVLFEVGEVVCPNQDNYPPFPLECSLDQNICTITGHDGNTFPVHIDRR